MKKLPFIFGTKALGFLVLTYSHKDFFLHSIKTLLARHHFRKYDFTFFFKMAFGLSFPKASGTPLSRIHETYLKNVLWCKEVYKI